MTTRILVATMVLSLLVSPKSFSQSFTPVGEHYLNVGEALGTVFAGSNVYRHPEAISGEKTLYFTPFFVFSGTGGELTVRTSILNDEEHQVTIDLEISPGDYLRGVAQYIREHERRNPQLKQHLTVTEGNLIPIEFLQMTVAQEAGEPVFESLHREAGLYPLVSLTATVPRTESQKIAEELRSGARELKFKVKYSLNARFTASESGAEAKGIYLYETNAVKRLKGAGTATDWSVGAEEGVLRPSSKAVTRKQADTFKGRLQREIEIFYDIENEADLDVLRADLINFFESTFRPEQIPIDKFHIDFARLAAYDFDPGDIRSDRVKELSADVKNFFSAESDDKFRFKGDLSVDVVGIFGGEVNVEVDKQTLRKRMEDRGWKFQASGEFAIPASLEVSVINETSLNEEAVVTVGIARRFRQRLDLESPTLSTVLNVYQKPGNDEDASFHELVGVPIGTIVAFGGATEPPGWNFCDGRELKQDNYPILFERLKNRYGQETADVFRLPDLRGRVALGAGSGIDLSERRLGSTGGFEKQTLKTGHLPDHYHLVYPHAAHIVARGPNDKREQAVAPHQLDTNWRLDAHSRTSGVNAKQRDPIPSADETADEGFSTMQPFQVINYIIRVE